MILNGLGKSDMVRENHIEKFICFSERYFSIRKCLIVLFVVFAQVFSSSILLGQCDNAVNMSSVDISASPTGTASTIITGNVKCCTSQANNLSCTTLSISLNANSAGFAVTFNGPNQCGIDVWYDVTCPIGAPDQQICEPFCVPGPDINVLLCKTGNFNDLSINVTGIADASVNAFVASEACVEAIEAIGIDAPVDWSCTGTDPETGLSLLNYLDCGSGPGVNINCTTPVFSYTGPTITDCGGKTLTYCFFAPPTECEPARMITGDIVLFPDVGEVVITSSCSADGAMVTMTASAPASICPLIYTWSNGEVGESITVASDCSVSYSVTATYIGESGCSPATATAVASCFGVFCADPDGGMLACGTPPPAAATTQAEFEALPGSPMIFGACSGVTIASEDSPLCDMGTYQIVRTYSISDGSSVKTCEVVYTYDNAAPIIDCPANVLVNCSADITAGTPTVTTSCMLGSTFSTSGPTLVSGTADCPGSTYEIIYTVVDDCGKMASCTQTFTIAVAETMITCPADAEVACEADIVVGTPTVVTACMLGSTDTSVGPTLVSGTSDCPGAKYEIVYTATDDCGAMVSCTQTFTIANAEPTIVCPADEIVACATDITEGVPTVTTSCGLASTVTTSGPLLKSGAADCPGAIYEIVYTVEDGCGRMASCTQTFTIVNDAPMITCPANEIVTCADDIMAGSPTVVTSCGVSNSVATLGPTLKSGTADCDGAIYEIVYTVTDACGRMASCTQTFTISNVGPSITCPADAVVACATDIAVGTPTISTSCGVTSSFTTTGPTLVTGIADCPGTTYEIVYTAVDACDRMASCTQTFTIANDAPTITCPADAVVACATDIVAGTPTVVTSCGVSSTFTTSVPTLATGFPNCPGATYEIVYTATDACGRMVSCMQTFTIANDAPTITCPADQVIGCAEDIVVGTPTVTTSCGLGSTITSVGPTLISGPANGDGSIYTIVYTVEDACGRMVSCTQTFTISNAGPGITCPADQNVDCVANIVAGTPTVSTSCGIGFTFVTEGPTLLTGAPDCPGATYGLLYISTDDLGRKDSCTQTFTIVNDAPTITCPMDEVVTCVTDITLGTPTVTTSCGVGSTVTTVGPTLVSGQANCSGAVYQVVYNVEDACGRMTSCIQSFTLSNTGPIVTCPADQIVSCASDISPGVSFEQTTCGLGSSLITKGPFLLSGEADCPGATYELRYVVMDDCSRQDSCSQIFTIANDLPTITCPADETVSCFLDILAGTPTFTTSCDKGGVVSTVGPTLVSGIDNCDGATYSIVYIITDGCDRVASCTQIFRISNTGPTITCPSNEVVTCVSDIVIGTPNVTTSCLLGSTVSHIGPTLVSGLADCSGSLYEVVYTVEDACGRMASCTQTFTISNAAPVIACPADQTVSCLSDIVVGTPSFITSCGVSGTVSTSGPTLISGLNNCAGARYEIVYTVTDLCGRSANCTQTFTIANDAPTISCPADRIVGCSSDITAEIPSFTTSCGLMGTLSTGSLVLESGAPDGDGSIYSITYTVVDPCGRMASCTQRFTIANLGPTITCVAGEIVECAADIVPSTPSFSVSCGLTSSMSQSDPVLISGSSDCNGAVYEITYSVTDELGRSANCKQTFTISNFGPTITCPANETVECLSDITVGTPVVTTNCGLEGVVTSTPPTLVSGIDNCAGSIYQITYTVTDPCGRSASCTQSFTIANAPPVITCPADTTVECEADIVAGVSSVVTACGVSQSVIVAGPTLVSGQANCDGAIYEITYTTTDICGRSASCIQTFTISNNGPTITCPTDQVVSCETDIFVGAPTVTSSCGLTTSVSSVGPTLVSGQANCEGAIYNVVYTVTDACGRSANCTQSFTIDNLGPMIMNCPSDLIVSCLSDVAPGTPQVETNCSLSFEVASGSAVLVSGQDNCNGAVYQIEYTAEDACGRTATCTQTFTLQNNGPSITCPTNAIVTCVDDISLSTPTVSTDCGLNSTVATSGPTLISGTDNADGAIYHVVYQVTDACGRTSSCTQLFTISNDGPMITCPADRTVECVGDIVAGTPDVTTSCGLTYTVSSTTPILVTGNEGCEGATYSITHTATDEINRSVSCTQTFTIANVGPSIICPPGGTVSCAADIIIEPFSAITTISCLLGAETTVTGPVITGAEDCNGSTYTYTYTITDDCGRSDSCEQDWTISNDGPQITCPSVEFVTCPDDIVNLVADVDVIVSCDMGYSVFISEPVIDGISGCFFSEYTYTYTVTDNCGRSATCERRFILESPGPTITCLPDTVVECASQIVNRASDAIVITSCGVGYNVTISAPTIEGIANCNGALYTFTYNVVDVCGRVASCTRSFTLGNDFELSIPADNGAQVACLEDAIQPNPPNTVLDGCGVPVIPTLFQISEDPTCDGLGTKSYIFRYTDCSSNAMDWTFTYTLADTISPLAPKDDGTIVECLGDAIQPEIPPDVVDNCGSIVSAIGPFATADPLCLGSGKKSYSWEYVDCSNNRDTFTYTYTIQDVTAPLIPANDTMYISCSADALPPSPPPSLIDNCGLSLEPIGPVSGSLPDCPGFGERLFTWEYADCSGNTSTYSFTYIIEDLTAPSFDVKPADITIDCDAPIPAPPTVISEDDCEGKLPILYTQVVEGDDDACPYDYTITRTWTSTDCNSNETQHVQIITVQDTTKPTISCPADLLVIGCSYDAAPAVDIASVSSSDNCSAVTITHEGDVVAGAGCIGDTLVVLRTYRSTDVCGNFSECLQTIKILDNVPPVITAASDLVVSCDDDVQALFAEWILNRAGATATDNCVNLIWSTIPEVPILDPCYSDGAYKVSFVVSDACGNSSNVSADFYVSCIGAAKNIVSIEDPATNPVDTANVDVTYQIIVKNTGNDTLCNVGLEDALSDQLGNAFINVEGDPIIISQRAVIPAVANTNYNGIDIINFFSNQPKLAPADSIIVQIEVMADPNAKGAPFPLMNQAKTYGDAVLLGSQVVDLSDSGTDPKGTNPFGDMDSGGEDDQTPFPSFPEIRVSKALVDVINLPNEDARLVFRLAVENTGNTYLDQLSLVDPLSFLPIANPFDQDIRIFINPIASDSLPSVSTTYNGVTDLNLFSGVDGKLAPEEIFEVVLWVEFNPELMGTLPQPITNQATVQGRPITPAGIPLINPNNGEELLPVSDDSDDGQMPNGNNDSGGIDDPTPIITPLIDVQKEVVGVIAGGAPGKFDVTFEVVIRNKGNTSISGVCLTDSLRQIYGANFGEVISLPTIVGGNANTHPTTNGDYNGDDMSNLVVCNSGSYAPQQYTIIQFTASLTIPLMDPNVVKVTATGDFGGVAVAVSDVDLKPLGDCGSVSCAGRLNIVIDPLTCQAIVDDAVGLSDNLLGIEFYDEDGGYLGATLEDNHVGQDLQYRAYDLCNGVWCWGSAILENKTVPATTYDRHEIMCGQKLPVLLTPVEFAAEVLDKACYPEIDNLLEETSEGGSICDQSWRIRKITGEVNIDGRKERVDLHIDSIIVNAVELDSIIPPFGSTFPDTVVVLDCADIEEYPSPEIIAEILHDTMAYPYLDKGTFYDSALMTKVVLRDSLSRQNVQLPDGAWIVTDVIVKYTEDSSYYKVDTLKDIIPIIDGEHDCNLSAKYVDEVFAGCVGEEAKIRRAWTIVDWCSGETWTSKHWIIVKDQTPPLIEELKDAYVSIAPWTCVANYTLPIPEIEDDCSDYTIVWKTTLGQVEENQIVNLWQDEGPATVSLLVTDACGNVGREEFVLHIVDDVMPVALATDYLNVSLSKDPTNLEGVAKVFADEINQESHDADCGEVSYCVLLNEELSNPIVRNGVQLTDTNGAPIYHPAGCEYDGIYRDTIEENKQFIIEEIPYVICKEFVKLCCQSIGTNKVALVVSDGSVYSPDAVSWTTVNVEDKSSAIVVCENITVSCNDSYHPDVIGYPTVYSAICRSSELTFVDEGDVSACGEGTIKRTWLIDGEPECVQRIFVEQEFSFDPYKIKWPKHYDGTKIEGTRRECELWVNEKGDPVLDNNGLEQYRIVEYDDDVYMGDAFECSSEAQLDEPTWCAEGCGLVVANFEPLEVEASDACKKIIRRWTVIDWCTWEENSENVDDDNDTSLDQFQAVDDEWLDADDAEKAGLWHSSYRESLEPTVYNYPDNGRITKLECEHCEKSNQPADHVYFRYSEVDEDGYYTFDQVIKVIDETEPVIQVEGTIVVEIFDGAGSKEEGFDNCREIIEVTATASDFCNGDLLADDRLTWTVYVLDELGQTVDGPLSGYGDSMTVSTGYGSHNQERVIVWTVSDGCSNSAKETSRVTFVDAKKPTPVCIQDLSTSTMSSNGSAVIWAEDYDRGSFDNCGPVEVMFKNEEGDFTRSLALNCSDLANGASHVFTLELYAIDEAGNYDFCNVTLRVDDNIDVCPDVNNGAVASISGSIYTPEGDMVEGVQVSDGVVSIMQTKSDGLYAFANLPMYQDYNVSGSKNDDLASGLTSADLVLIQQHILGQRKLDNAYKVIAADVNNDERISALDLIELRRVILGLSDQFANNESWRFIDANQTFDDPQKPWPIQEEVSINFLSEDMSDENLIGIKVGDVNGSVVANSTLLSGGRSDDRTVFSTVDQSYQDGEVIQLSIHKNTDIDLSAIQFTLELDGLELVGMTSDAGVSMDDIGQHGSDRLTLVAYNVMAVRGEQVLTLSLKANKTGSIKDHVKMSSSITSAKVYDRELKEYELFLAIEESEPPLSKAYLLQNEPNPFKDDTAIGFYLPKGSSAELSFYDAAGRLLHQVRDYYKEGINSVVVTSEDLQATGVVYYQLIVEDIHLQKRMIILD